MEGSDISAATTTAATDVSDAITAYSVAATACRLILRIVIAGKYSLDHVDDQAATVPPTYTFLLMRCQSTPTKSWLEEANRVEEDEEEIMGVNKI
ncbi:hypothetical protein PVK06_016344 [Gossypium arboreum]|uniref:Uncharacterized protein n=1 Tax=Gossypium arboreum TaxID=29729 RepID=A0ABR0Q013_GOSAR|nr:hypothetical protein PVK06_016344 [Gossypium arboreum]